MCKQCKYDIKYVLYTKKYWIIAGLVVGLSCALCILEISQTHIRAQALSDVFARFRQFYWMLAVYIITDIITIDFHAKTFKNVIPKLNHRGVYIASKLIIACFVCCFILFLHFFTTWLCMGIFFRTLCFPFYNIGYLLLGNICALLLFESGLMLVMFTSKKETITFGIAMGAVLLIMLVESMDQDFCCYLPTMLLTCLGKMIHEQGIMALFVVFGYIMLSTLLFFGTMKLFRKADIDS